MTSLKILEDKDTGGSGTGNSLYTNPCGRKTILDKKLGSGSGADASVGRMFHTLMEYWYPGKMNEIALPDSDVTASSWAAGEAMRLFTAYTERYKPTDLEVISIEQQLPSNDEQKHALHEAFGIPITARMDMLVNITQEHIDAMAETRPELAEIQPGRWIWDFKTKKRTGNTDVFRYSVDTQFMLYPALWNYLHPDEPVLGMIADCIVRNKEVKFYTIAVPALDVHEAMSILVPYYQRKYATHKLGHVELTACFDWGKVCPHYETGACDRKPST